MSLKNRVALITGGAGHLGMAMAGALAEAGAGIVILDLDPARCEAAAAQLAQQHGVPVMPVAVDLSDTDQLARVPDAVVKKLGGLNIVINVAALVGTSQLEGWAVPFESQSIATWRRALEINLTAAFALVQAAASPLRESGHGSVINVSSIYGLSGPDWRLYEGTDAGNPAAYAASKGGLLQLTRWLATTLAPNIRVNAITPGGVWRGQKESFVTRYIDRTPMKRMATEEDFKGAALYLASDLSAYVTGQNVIVDGGWTAW